VKHLSSIKKKAEENWLDVAKNSKKEGVSEIKEAELRLLSKYSIYENIITNHNIKPSETNVSDIKITLKKFYEYPPAKLGNLLKIRRNNHDLNECPFCGNPFSPNTLDHFIPKEEWPEFAIFPNNLVPQCKDCAPIKGKKYFSELEKKAIFIHPIYNDLLSKIKFKISVVFDENKKEPTFNLNITIPLGILDEDKSRISCHFKELKIKERVSIFSLREYNSWIRKLKQYSFDIKAGLQQRINEIPEIERYKDWKTSLYQAILDSDALMEHLSNITISNSQGLNSRTSPETEDLPI